MANRQNTIELNGNLYDVSTGRLLAAKPAAQPNGGKTIDGVIRRAGRAGPPARLGRRATSGQAHAVHVKISPSKTLMRGAVRKPERPATTTSPLKKQLGLPSPARLKRARQIPKSSLVNKFSRAGPGVRQKIEPLAVRAAPAQSPPATAAPVVALAPRDLKMDLFETALKNATSHLEPKPKIPRRHRLARKLRLSPRALNAGAVALAGLIIAGAIVYHSMPAITVNLAGWRAGVDATLPRHQPPGFRLAGPIEYSRGWIALNYRSDIDHRSFRLTQRVTDWGDRSLHRNFVAKQPDARAIESGGRLIFVYGTGNATWISGGIWYKIEGDAALSQEQLIKIATSL